MTAPDFAATLADAGFSSPLSGYLAPEAQARTVDAQLAARVPDLCPNCDQGDVARLPYSETCPHPNAPTIGTLLAEAAHARQVAAEAGVDVDTLLAYGRNVATAKEWRFGVLMDPDAAVAIEDATEPLDALRTVEVERCTAAAVTAATQSPRRCLGGFIRGRTRRWCRD